MSQVIAHAIAPAFVLGAVAGFTSILRRDWKRSWGDCVRSTHSPTGMPRRISRPICRGLKRRAELTNRAIFYSVISAVISAALLIVAFICAFFGIEHVYGAGMMFMIALLYLVAALITFALEVRIALTEYDHHTQHDLKPERG